MAPRVDSDYQYSRAFRDDQGNLYLEIPQPPIRAFGAADDVIHVVGPNESLHIIAYRYFNGMENPQRFWRAIAKYNGIVDASLPLQENSVLLIPALRTLRETILAPPADYLSLIASVEVGS
jgi:hypothetical protein